MLTSRRNPIIIPPGVNKDDNSYTSFQWSDADKIRFYKGYPQKLGGWQSVFFNNSQTLTGVPRSIWAYTDALGIEHILIGTNTRLYSFEQGSLYNITPLVTSTTAIANSLATNFNTLGSNPVTTITGSKTVTLNIGATLANISRVGDFIQISGATNPFNGLNPNGTFTISSISGGNITYQAAVAASGAGSGGGASVVLSQRVITVAQTAHGFLEGDRIKIASATAFGGFAIGDLNIEAIVRYINANSYAYYSTTADTSGHFATSSASSGGGAGTTVQGQIAAGQCAIAPAVGYGGGPYGLGSYGTGKPFSAGFAYPRIWSFDRLGESVVLTPGNQGGLYLWGGNVATAPVLQTAGSAPTAINYVAVHNNQIVTLGAAGVPNRVFSSSDITNWVPGPAVQVFLADILTSGTLLTTSYCKGQIIIFADSSVHKMTYVGVPTIFVIDEIMTSDGLLGPKAATSVQDNVVWIGQDNFYIYNGSSVAIIPDNSLREWFYSNLNQATYYHTFAHKSVDFAEVWWFAPFASSEEPTNYVIWNWEEGHFTNGTLTRTCSEEPSNVNRYQYLATGSCDGSIPTTKLYTHEVKDDYTDDGGNMSGSLTSNSNLIDTGEYMQEILRVVPSNAILPLQNLPDGNLFFNMFIYTKEYDGMITPRTFGPYPIYDNTLKIETRANGRQRQYEFIFNNLVGFRIQKYFEELRTTTAR